MPRYTPTVDIWELTREARRALPIGQWVKAGPDGPRGRFYGEGRSTVVAWRDNGRRDWRGYCAMIRDYGRTVTR